ncbi:MAG: class I SAM-dependent methyltransferase [Candidatus Acidiferrales bacterium]
MRTRTSKPVELPQKIRKHYDRAQERSRLFTHAGRLEFLRTKELISRHLPKKRAVILDIGGGPGAYGFWLANLGHAVHLVDAVPKHIRQAEQTSRSRRGHPLASARVGDARDLEFNGRIADAALLLGPLYHLVEKRDRLKALREARRTLRPGGLLFAAVISRFASAFDGLWRNFIADPEFFRTIQRDLRSGQHRNRTNHPDYFTTAFFHHPDEIRNEIREAGFEAPQLYAIEGPGWLLPNFERAWTDPALKRRLLKIVRAVETEAALLGQSAHILAVARKKR